jgi:hypothetical protein
MSQLKNYGRLLMRAAPLLNAPVTAMATSRRFGRIVGRNIAIITYQGQRSGRSFSLPVAYRRNGDDLEIAANMPEAKSWWRNFLGDGAPLRVRLDGVERPGHAVARRDEHGHVTVRVRLGAL